jgi:dipeptidyl aminopeptidase/acylaminoacyl peptidase
VVNPIDPRKPPQILTEGVPQVPEEIFERLHPYQHVRAAAFCGWAPDGRGVLVRTRFANSEQLHRVLEPGHAREQLTFHDEPVSGRFLPGSADGTMLLVMSRGGDENHQVYRLTPGRGRAERLTDGTSRHILGPVRRDGSLLLLASNRRHPRHMDLYTLDPWAGGPLQTLLQTEGQDWRAHDWSPDGRSILIDRVVSVHETYPALLEVPSGRLHPIPAPGGVRCAFGELAFAPDGRSAYVTTDACGEFLQLMRLDLQSFRTEALSEDIPWDVSEVEVDPRSGRVAFTTNEDGASRLHLLDGGRRLAVELPLGVVSGLEFSPDGRSLGFTLARSDAPADVYSVDTSGLTLTRWTYSEIGGLSAQDFVGPEAIRFRSFDGLEVPAHVLRPPGASRERPAPVLILIHGGPESQYRPSFSANEQLYVKELGCAVIGPNVRGSSGYGKTYLSLDNAEKREDSVRDIGALLDWISEQPDLDASRVAVSGGSYGGYMALASLIHFGDRLCAGIDRVGIANFVTFLERTSPYRQDLRRAEYGDERDPQMRAILEQMSPTTHADKIRSALLIAHGANDPRVPLYEAHQIAEKVRAAGREVWTLYAYNEGHGFGRKDNNDYLTAVVVLFLRKHLL